MTNNKAAVGGGSIYAVALVLLFLADICSTMATVTTAAPTGSVFHPFATSTAAGTNRPFPPATVSTKIAIVRPFSVNDASKLPGSFVCWSTFPPCDVAGSDHDSEDQHQPSYSVDLYLAFSQSLDEEANTTHHGRGNNVSLHRNEPSQANHRNNKSNSTSSAMIARAMMDAVGSIFQDTNGWAGCIDRVYGFGCNIDPTMDLYESGESCTNPLWVNGPNRQFERTMRTIQQHAGPYDATYLMEMDSVPVKAYWLDLLVKEVENRPSDFAILGR